MGRGTRTARQLASPAPGDARLGAEELRRNLRRPAHGAPSWIAQQPASIRPAFRTSPGTLRRVRDLLVRTGAAYAEIVPQPDGSLHVQFDDESLVTSRYRLTAAPTSG